MSGSPRMQILLAENVGHDGDQHGAFVEEFAPPSQSAVENGGPHAQHKDGQSADSEAQADGVGESEWEFIYGVVQLIKKNQG